MIEIFVRYDSKYNNFERKIYSLLDILGDIGGLYQSLYVLGFLSVNFLAYRIFVANLLKHIYQVKKDRSEKKVATNTNKNQ